MNNWARNSVGKYAPIGATADDLPLAPPSGKKTITANGNDIDVSSYATADVNVPNPSTGKKTITTTAEVDVTSYATAQVVDANLTAENIKKDVVILGTTGSYEGGGGSSDFTTANITFVNNRASNTVTMSVPMVLDVPEAELAVANNQIYLQANQSVTISVILYKGLAWASLLSYEGVIETVSGDVILDLGDDTRFIISGDGTITITDA